MSQRSHRWGHVLFFTPAVSASGSPALGFWSLWSFMAGNLTLASEPQCHLALWEFSHMVVIWSLTYLLRHMLIFQVLHFCADISVYCYCPFYYSPWITLSWEFLLDLNPKCFKAFYLTPICYVWMLCPPKFTCWDPNAQWGNVRRWGFGEIIRSWGWSPYKWG